MQEICGVVPIQNTYQNMNVESSGRLLLSLLWPSLLNYFALFGFHLSYVLLCGKVNRLNRIEKFLLNNNK